MRTIACEGEGAFGAAGVIREGGKGRGVKVCIGRSVSIVVGVVFLNPGQQVQLLASAAGTSTHFTNAQLLFLSGFDFIVHGVLVRKSRLLVPLLTKYLNLTVTARVSHQC